MNAAKDPLKRRALQTMIETYGQTPRKLFSMPHVQRFSKTLASPLSDMMTSLPQAVENLMNPSITRDRLYSKVEFQKSCTIRLRDNLLYGINSVKHVFKALTKGLFTRRWGRHPTRVT